MRLKTWIAAGLAWLLLPGLAFGQVKLGWTDNSDNEAGFIVERKVDLGAWAELARVGANTAGFVDAKFVPGKLTYRVSAFNTAGKSNPSNEAAISYFADYPVFLQGTVLPEQGFIIVKASVPKNATSSELQMRAFDADQKDEGQLWINSNGPVALFGASLGSDGEESLVKFAVPVNYWRDGENKLTFSHTKSAGYKILSAQVTFAVPLLAPSELKIAH